MRVVRRTNPTWHAQSPSECPECCESHEERVQKDMSDPTKRPKGHACADWHVNIDIRIPNISGNALDLAMHVQIEIQQS